MTNCLTIRADDPEWFFKACDAIEQGAGVMIDMSCCRPVQARAMLGAIGRAERLYNTVSRRAQTERHPQPFPNLWRDE